MSARRRFTDQSSWLPAILVVLSAGAWSATPAWAGLISAPVYLAGPQPRSIAVGDFNEDAILDIAVANYNPFGNGGVSILLGRDDGTFLAPQSYAINFSPDSVAVGDFNGDGHLDLAVAGSVDDRQSTATILLGQGDGTFVSGQSHSYASGGGSVAVGDFNEDGILDLAFVSSGNAGMVTILPGQGDGTFQAVQSYAGGTNPLSVTVADFNGDGHLDLAVLNYDSHDTVTIFLGSGDGSFQPSGSYPGGGSMPGSLAVGDVNGDGLPDLLVAGWPGVVTVLLNKGNGRFQTAHIYFIGPMRNYGVVWYSVAVGDLDRDGHLDIVVTDDLGVTILLGNGDGSFQTPRNYAAGDGPGAIAVEDFNRDGMPDLAVINVGIDPDNQGTVSVLRGKGDGTFQAAPSYGPIAKGVAVGDFNGDGILDLAIASAPSLILLGKGDGTFQPGQAFAEGPSPVAVAVGDFNGDGKLDLVTADFVYQSFRGYYSILESDVRIYLGNGDGTFQTAGSQAAGLGPNSIAIGDFNDDGNADLAIANYNPFTGVSTVSVLLGKGNGTFEAAQNYPVAPIADSVALGDLNGDGHLDIVVANYKSNSVSLLLGNGDGTFQPAQTIAVGGGARSVAVADFNGDGIPDLVVANPGSSSTYTDGSVAVLLGRGDGTFLAPQNYTAGAGPVFVTIADFNRDGILDLAVMNSVDGTVSILLGRGDGTFQSAQVAAAGTYPDLTNYTNDIYPNSLAVGDLNGDGYLDLVVANTVTVLLNDGNWPP